MFFTRTKSVAPRNQPKPCLGDLPVELQRQIIMEVSTPRTISSLPSQLPPQFLKDPNMTFHDLQVLRLVCRTFNAIVAPYVLSCICLFRDEKDLLGNLRQLRTLLSSKPNQHLSMADTLVLKEWTWIYGVSPYLSYNDLPTIGPLIFLNSLIALLFLVSLPYTLPTVTFKTGIRLSARFHLWRKYKINLPNIRRVV
jgi:hypothetical protein